MYLIATSFLFYFLKVYIQECFEGDVFGICNSLFASSAAQADSLLLRKSSIAWERAKRSLLEIAPSIAVGAAKDMTMIASNIHRSLVGGSPKAQAFLSVVRRINEGRRTGQNLPVAGMFGRALAALDGNDIRTEQLVDCWTALGIIFGEQNDGEGGLIAKETTEANLFATSDNFSNQSARIVSSRLAITGSLERRRWETEFTRKSRQFLQEQFRRHIDRTLSQYPRDALVGGKPSAAERVKAFALLKIKRMTAGEVERIEIIQQHNNLPIWMVLFYFLRGGLFEEAIRLVQAVEQDTYQRIQPASILGYLRAAYDSSDGTTISGISGHQLVQLRSEYAQLLLMPRQDPFKLTVLKLLGRCDLGRKTVPEAIETSEDYLWLQLWLIDADPIGKDPQQASSIDQRYSLTDLQKSVSELGTAYFDPRGKNPIRFFQILLLTGQYEAAVGFLASSSGSTASAANSNVHRLIDAVHFAICLVYHSSLRLVASPDPALWEILLEGSDPQINFAVLLDGYARQVGKADRLDALQYLLLIALPHQEAYDRYARECIREAVLESGDVGALLGDVARDGSLIEGYLSRYLRLLHLPDQTAFMSEITVQAAQRSQRDGRFLEAMQLYNIAGDYGQVLGLLARQGGSLFASGAPDRNELVTFMASSTSILEYYTGNPRIQSSIDRDALRQVQGMRNLLEARRAFEEERWSEAVELVQSLGFIPVSSDAAAIARAADTVKRMPDILTASLPQALLLAMNSLHRIYLACRPYAYSDPGRKSLLEQTRMRSRAILLLLGMIRMRVSADICAQITRIDVLINEGA